MKTVKAKLHLHHRKTKTVHHPIVRTAHVEAGYMEPDFVDPDLQIYRIERSPKQEDL